MAVLAGRAGGSGAASLGFTWIAFLTQLASAVSFNVTAAPYVSDYSRYLPTRTPRAAIILNVFVHHRAHIAEAPHRAARVDARQTRQHQIEHNEGGYRLLDLRQSRVALGNGNDGKAFATEEGRQEPRDLS